MNKSPKMPVWKKKNTKGKSVKLTPELIELAKERAAKAGRRYPNLIDNMWAAKHSNIAVKRNDSGDDFL